MGSIIFWISDDVLETWSSIDCLPSDTKTVIMDDAGDSHEMYDIAYEYGVKLITPPRKRFVYPIGPEKTRRDEYIKEIREDGDLAGQGCLELKVVRIGEVT